MSEVGWCEDRDQWLVTIERHLPDHGYVVAVDVPQFTIDISHRQLAPATLSHLAKWQLVSVATYGEVERVLLRAIADDKPVIVHGFVDFALTLELPQITSLLTLIANCCPGYVCDTWPHDGDVDGHRLPHILAKWVYKHD